MLPVPTLPELAEWSGRPEVSYTAYANSALLQATVMFTTLSELTAETYPSLTADDQVLAQQGILAMGDYIYLRQPYQQVIAGPMQNETIGSYSYSKPEQEMARNAQALEVTAERTGVDMFDLAIRMLSRRQRANGVFSGQITGFEHFAKDDAAHIKWDKEEQRMVLTGPADRDKYDIQFFDINSQAFPGDPA
jgi:hypothetical protein